MWENNFKLRKQFIMKYIQMFMSIEVYAIFGIAYILIKCLLYSCNLPKSLSIFILVLQ